MASRIAVFTIGLFLMAGTVEAKLGVVLIHGKGRETLERPAEAIRYWSDDMIGALKKGDEPPLVCHYDGTQHMTVAANEVAKQIDEWMTRREITQLVIYTHSFGGVVIRVILTNKWRKPRYQRIINAIVQVNSIAPPNAGSEAANLAGTLSEKWHTGWLVDLLAQNTASTQNCTTGSMKYYNDNFLDGTAGRPLPRTVCNIAGTGLYNDFETVDRLLAVLSATAGLPGEDDGMVAQYSAQAVGKVKFTTLANHNHNRRNDYRAVGEKLAKAYAEKGCKP